MTQTHDETLNSSNRRLVATIAAIALILWLANWTADEWVKSVTYSTNTSCSSVKWTGDKKLNMTVTCGDMDEISISNPSFIRSYLNNPNDIKCGLDGLNGVVCRVNNSLARGK